MTSSRRSSSSTRRSTRRTRSRSTSPKRKPRSCRKWDKKHFRFTFYGNGERQMDRVVELMTRFGLACYDAATRKMYSVGAPPPSFQGTPEDQSFFDALNTTLSKAAGADARASSARPQERLKQLKAFIDSGAAKAALDEEMKRSQRKKRKK